MPTAFQRLQARLAAVRDVIKSGAATEEALSEFRDVGAKLAVFVRKANPADGQQVKFWPRSHRSSHSRHSIHPQLLLASAIMLTHQFAQPTSHPQYPTSPHPRYQMYGPRMCAKILAVRDEYDELSATLPPTSSASCTASSTASTEAKHAAAPPSEAQTKKRNRGTGADGTAKPRVSLSRPAEPASASAGATRAARLEKAEKATESRRQYVTLKAQLESMADSPVKQAMLAALRGLEDTIAEEEGMSADIQAMLPACTSTEDTLALLMHQLTLDSLNACATAAEGSGEGTGEEQREEQGEGKGGGTGDGGGREGQRGAGHWAPEPLCNTGGGEDWNNASHGSYSFTYHWQPDSSDHGMGGGAGGGGGASVTRGPSSDMDIVADGAPPSPGTASSKSLSKGGSSGRELTGSRWCAADSAELVAVFVGNGAVLVHLGLSTTSGDGEGAWAGADTASAATAATAVAHIRLRCQDFVSSTLVWHDLGGLRAQVMGLLFGATDALQVRVEGGEGKSAGAVEGGGDGGDGGDGGCRINAVEEKEGKCGANVVAASTASFSSVDDSFNAEAAMRRQHVSQLVEVTGCAVHEAEDALGRHGTLEGAVEYLLSGGGGEDDGPPPDDMFL